MASTVEALETALYSRLSTSAALISELGGTAIYNKRAPQDVGSKYVIFQWQGGGDDNITPHRTRNVLYFVAGVGLTQAAAAAIDTDIDTALHNQVLTVTGWHNASIARDRDINFVENDNANVPRFTVGGIYRIRLETK
jgi:hypothetical protein